jgi:hypothetical protein
MVSEVSIHHDRKGKAEQSRASHIMVTRNTPKDPHLSTYFLQLGPTSKFLAPLKIEPPAGPSEHELLGVTLHIQTIAFYSWPPKGSCPSHNANHTRSIPRAP